MRNVRRLVFGVAIAAPVFLAACGRGDHDIQVSMGKRGADPDAKFVKRDSTRKLGPNDVQIASTDSAVEVAIIGDSIVAGLGKKVLDEVRDKTDSSTVSGSGFAAGIEKMVKSSVADALGHQLIFPVSEVGDVRAENGGLQFYAKDGSKMHMFENSDHGKKHPSAFSDADAQRFIAAFKARKAATTS